MEVMEKGSHEARMFQAVDKDTGSLQAELMVYLRCAPLIVGIYMYISLKPRLSFLG